MIQCLIRTFDVHWNVCDDKIDWFGLFLPCCIYVLKHKIGNLHVGKRRGAKTKVATKYVLPPTQSLVLKQMDSLKTLRVNTQNFCMNNFTKTFYVVYSYILTYVPKLCRPKSKLINTFSSLLFLKNVPFCHRVQQSQKGTGNNRKICSS